MNIRPIRPKELPDLLRLYGFLHPEAPEIDPNDPAVHVLWDHIFENPNLRYYVAEKEHKLVSTCMLTIIPNLTHDLRPYGMIQNVVTDPQYRKKGYASRVLRYALEEAWEAGCYKVILSTGDKSKNTLRFYQNVGFQSGVKTCFVAFPEM